MFDHPTLRAIADLVQSQIQPESPAVSATPEAKAIVRSGSFLTLLLLAGMGDLHIRPAQEVTRWPSRGSRPSFQGAPRVWNPAGPVGSSARMQSQPGPQEGPK